MIGNLCYAYYTFLFISYLHARLSWLILVVNVKLQPPFIKCHVKLWSTILPFDCAIFANAVISGAGFRRQVTTKPEICFDWRKYGSMHYLDRHKWMNYLLVQSMLESSPAGIGSWWLVVAFHMDKRGGLAHKSIHPCLPGLDLQYRHTKCDIQ